MGKTTVSCALAQYGRNAVHIRGDALKHWIIKRTDNEVADGLGYKNGAMAAANYLRGGYDLVVFDYVFEHPGHVHRFLEHVGSDLTGDVFLFTLWAPREVVLERERVRPGRDPLGQRVNDCYTAIEAELPRLGCRIDNVGETPGEVAARILALCEAGTGRLTVGY